jgi:CO dehydrogenase/acetyl-CoA synthase alpha subunit
MYVLEKDIPIYATEREMALVLFQRKQLQPKGRVRGRKNLMQNHILTNQSFLAKHWPPIPGNIIQQTDDPLVWKEENAKRYFLY